MNRVHLHHATPLLRATLCKRGECKPDVHNTVLFGIIHVKYHPLVRPLPCSLSPWRSTADADLLAAPSTQPYLHYVRHVVTWNVTEPYNYLSVSRPLTYSGTNQADPIFTVSMAWDHPTTRHGLGLNHGFLDDTVIISFGVADYGSGYTVRRRPSSPSRSSRLLELRARPASPEPCADSLSPSPPRTYRFASL